MPSVAEVIDFLHRFAPLELAAEWDNVGLLLGDGDGPAERIMTCLTVTADTAAEAVDAGPGLIVAHHPILFRGCQRLTAASAEGRMLLSLIRAGIAVYSPHTAFDNTTGGINDMIAAKLGLQKVRPLRRRQGGRCKVVVFVPQSDLDKVADAMFAAGAGQIGQYSQCSFRIPGTGTFFGSESSNPTLGHKGRREDVAEWRLEAVCGEDAVDRVVAAMRKAHSYEEPAFDVYQLLRTAGQAGQGRIGELAEAMPLPELAGLVRKELEAGYVHMVGDAARPVQSVAIVCGSGGDFVSDAARARADVLLTGEARFHDCLAAQASGLALLLPGHYATERPGVEALANMLATQFTGARVWASVREKDPLEIVPGA